ncbi:Hypothetical protein D9617_57g029040 [Elsinoe fawcettii]|nr:Hypothetical protein D9617_57g029040 [Elsinoe fawcettii]
MRKLRAIINKTVDRKTKKVIKRLSDDLQKSRAKATLERLGKQQAMEALRHEKKKRKRGKKLIEQFRADEGSGAILFSPGKVRAAFELQDRREQEKEQEIQNREQRAQERALEKVTKEQEIQKRREGRATAQAARKAAEALKKAQRETERATKKAQKQAEIELKAQNKKPRGRPKKRQVPTEPVAIRELPRAEEAPIQPRSSSLSLSQLRDRVLGDWDSSASDLDMQTPWTQLEPFNQAASPIDDEYGVEEDETEEETEEEEVLGPDDLMEDPPLDLYLDDSDDLDSQLASQKHVRFDPSPSKSSPPPRRQSSRSTKGKEPSRFSPEVSANPQPRQAPSKSTKVAEHRKTTLESVNNDPPVVSKSAREVRVEQRAKKRKPPPAKPRTSSKSRKTSSTKGFKDIDKIQKGGARGAKKKAISEVSASQTSMVASSGTSRDPPLSFKHSVRRQAPPEDPSPPSIVDIMVHWSVHFGTEVVWSDSNIVSTEGDLAQFDVDSLTAANDHAIGAGLTSASRRRRTARLSTNLTKNSDAGIWSAFDTTRHWLVVIQAAQLAFKNKRKEIKLTATDYWSNSLGAWKIRALSDNDTSLGRIPSRKKSNKAERSCSLRPRMSPVMP